MFRKGQKCIEILTKKKGRRTSRSMRRWMYSSTFDWPLLCTINIIYVDAFPIELKAKWPIKAVNTFFLSLSLYQTVGDYLELMRQFSSANHTNGIECIPFDRIANKKKQVTRTSQWIYAQPSGRICKQFSNVPFHFICFSFICAAQLTANWYWD